MQPRTQWLFQGGKRAVQLIQSFLGANTLKLDHCPLRTRLLLHLPGEKPEAQHGGARAWPGFLKIQCTRRGQAASQYTPAPTRIQGGVATGHQGLATDTGTPLPGLPLLGAGYQEQWGTGWHPFPAGCMPDWGAHSFQGTHTCLRPTASGLRDTLAVTPHLLPDPGNHKPTLSLSGFSCSGHFVEMESHILWFFLPALYLGAHLLCRVCHRQSLNLYCLPCVPGTPAALAPSQNPGSGEAPHHTPGMERGVAHTPLAQWLLTPGPLTSAQNPLSFPFCKLTLTHPLGLISVASSSGKPSMQAWTSESLSLGSVHFPHLAPSCRVWNDTSSCHPLCLICLLG